MRIAAAAAAAASCSDANDDDDDTGIAVLVGSSAAVLAPMRDVMLTWPAGRRRRRAHSVCVVRACTPPAICHAKTNSAAGLPAVGARSPCLEYVVVVDVINLATCKLYSQSSACPGVGIIVGP